MKMARFVLKIVGISLAFAGIVCLIIGFWDRLSGNYGAYKERIVAKMNRPSEYDDFADVPEF